jgi:cytochrome P450
VERHSTKTLFQNSAQTVSAIANFFLAMVLYPDVQFKAQAEIDSVIGVGKLPGFKDRASLPYVDALVKEVLRWGAVGPIGERNFFLRT